MQTILDGNYTAKRCVLVLGIFDGVHIGHRVLLRRGAALARQHRVPLVVCTFQDHPLRLIAPDKCPPQLTTLEERKQLMEALGVDVLYAQPFTREIMNTPAPEYVGELVRRFHPVHVVCGYNHTYGQKGEGTPALLEVLGGALGFGVSIVPKITLEGQDVSSTVIRQQLTRGNAAMAHAMLGRPYLLEGQAVSRKENGVYTVRLARQGKQSLPDGTYQALAGCGEKRYPVVAKLKNQQIMLRLPVLLKCEQTVRLEFLNNLSIDF